MTIDQIDELKGLVFKHRVRLQKRFSDVDMFGHVNNAVQIVYFDLGKVAYLKDVGFSFPEESGDALVVVHSDVDYLSQVFFDGDLEVWSKVVRFGHKSMSLVQLLVDPSDGDVKSIGRMVMCGYNLKVQTSVEIRPHWKMMVQTFEDFQQ